MALFIILIIVALIISWLLFSPVIIRLDTINHSYYIKVLGIVKVSPLWNESGFKLSIHLPLYDFYITPKGGKKKSVPHKEVKVKRSTRLPLSMAKIKAILKSFKVKEFKMMIDTNDYYWNGLLTPLAYLIQVNGANIAINFNGENQCQLMISNTLWKVGRAYLISNK